MVNAVKNTENTHTLRLLADAASMKKGLDAVDKELSKVVVQLNNHQAAAMANKKAADEQARAAKEQSKALAASARETEQAAAALENLVRKYDPAYDATQRFNQGMAEVKSLLDKGRISSDRYAEAVDRLRDEKATAIAQADGTADALLAEQRAADALAKEYDQLKSKYDPLYRTSKQYQRLLTELDRAHNINALSTAQHRIEVDKLEREYEEFQAGIHNTANRFTAASRGFTKGYKQTGLIAQQAGYQLQDFAVQVQGGTNALVALGQQGSQMLGFFGPGGAIAGAVLAIGTAIAVPLLALIGKTEETKDAMQSLVDAMQRMADTDALSQPGLLAITTYDELLGKIREVAEEQQRQAQQAFMGSVGLDASSLTGAQFALRMGDRPEQFEALGIESYKEALFLNARLRDIFDAQGDAQTELVQNLDDALRFRGMSVVAAKELQTSLIEGLGLEERITKQAEARTKQEEQATKWRVEAIRAEEKARQDQWRDEIEAMNALVEAEQKLIELEIDARRHAAIAAIRNEEEARVAAIREEIEAMNALVEAEVDAQDRWAESQSDMLGLLDEHRAKIDEIRSANLSAEEQLVRLVDLARKEAEERIRATVATEDLKTLTEEQRAELEAAVVEAQNLAEQTAREAEALKKAADESKELANGLNDAASAMASLVSFGAGLDKQLAQAQARVEAIRNGTNAANAGRIAGMELDNTTKLDAALADGQANYVEVMGQFFENQRKIKDLDATLTAEQEAIAKQRKDGGTSGTSGTGRAGGGGTAEEDALAALMRELEVERELLGVEETRREILEKLGEDASKYSEEQINDAIALRDEITRLTETYEMHEQAVDAVTGAMSTALMDMITGAKSFEDAMLDMIATIGKELFNILVLQQLIGKFDAGAGTGSGLAGMIGKALFAEGAAFDGGNVVPFATGGVVGGPTVFPMTGGQMGLMGESGPEAIMPLQRTSSGDLGVAGPAIEINNYTGQSVTVDRTEDIVRIAVGQSRQAVQSDFAKSMASGQGSYARSIEGGYSARRKL